MNYEKLNKTAASPKEPVGRRSCLPTIEQLDGAFSKHLGNVR